MTRNVRSGMILHESPVQETSCPPVIGDSFRLGEVIVLATTVEGVDHGFYVMIGPNKDTICLARAGMDAQGAVCATNSFVYVSTDDLSRFESSGLCIDPLA
jgi:hypothetical protein